MRGTDAHAKVAAALRKALELDDSLAEAHTASGSAKSYYEYDWEAAEKEFQRAIELNPGYATAHQWYAQMLGAESRGDEALAEHLRASELDPLSLIIHAGTIHRLYLLRRYADAARTFHRASELDPDFPSAHWNLGLVLTQQKDFAGGIRELHKADLLLQGNALVLGGLAYAYGASGNLPRARMILRRLQNQAQKDYVDPYAFVLAYVGLDDSDKAFRWLKRAVADRDPWVTFMNSEPMLDRLRSDPRFHDLLRR